jgi:flagellar biosynthesis/type III secretory pathway protein FliH
VPALLRNHSVDMRQRPSDFDDPPALDPETLLCVEIDIDLRDVWEALDQALEVWDDQHLAVTASAMRVAYERGRVQGETEGISAGHQAGYEDGYEDGREDGRQEGCNSDALGVSGPFVGVRGED